VFVSLHLSPQSRGADEDVEVVERVIAQAIEAERQGVAAVCLTEHHLAGFNGYTDPFVLGAYLAGKLATAHVALTVAQVQMHHPVKLVERCNLLDLLTRGKCFIALGPGFKSLVEMAAFGLDDIDGAQVTNERIDAMFRAWSWTEEAGTVDVSTSVDRGTMGARVSPSSYRRPRPLVGRATMTDQTIRATAARGMPVVFGPWASTNGRSRAQFDLYHETLAGGGFDDDTVAQCLSWAVFTVPLVIAPTERHAKARLEDYRDVAALGPFRASLTSDYPWVAEWARRETARAAVAVVGSPQQLIDHIGESIDAGARGVRLMPIQVAGRADDQSEMLELLYRDVLPHLSPEPLPSPDRGFPEA
jgi:alkanesulfonate monooxygenase SsuD/methylene tetrahydromethanopterin reductase-like flavin-dependent oxidoreductase (luciferase family)